MLIEKKKAEKRKRLLDSAYCCFLEHGISNTSIFEICSRAGIAKGTFYLYFKDKDDIMKALNFRLSYALLKDAHEWVKSHSHHDFIEDTVMIADYIIASFEKDPGILQLLRRDFTWPVANRSLIESKDPLITEFRTEMANFAKASGQNMNHIVAKVFSLAEMVASVSYSAIIEHYPSEIAKMKPTLLAIIRSALLKA